MCRRREVLVVLLVVARICSFKSYRLAVPVGTASLLIYQYVMIRCSMTYNTLRSCQFISLQHLFIHKAQAGQNITLLLQQITTTMCVFNDTCHYTTSETLHCLWRLKVVGNTELLSTITRPYRAQEDNHWYFLCYELVVNSGWIYF